MAKTDKSNKKAASKKSDLPKPAKPTPASTPTVVKKTAKPAHDLSDSDSDSSDSSSDKPKVSAPLKTTPANAQKAKESSSNASSSAESSSEDSDEEMAPPGTSTTAKKSDSEDDSDASSSEDENPAGQGASAVKSPAKKAPASSSEESSSEEESAVKLPAKKMAGSKDDSSDASSSEESSGGSDSDEEEEGKKPKAPPSEANKKRKADTEPSAPPKKAKLPDGTANPISDEESRGIFVGRLSWNVDNDWLAEEFAECGEIESAHVQMDRNTGRSRGFGYVNFKTADAVEKALALNGKEIDGRPVNVDRSSSPDKKASADKRAQAFGDKQSPPSAVLFVGNLSFGVNEDALWETFGEHGDVKNVRVPTDRDTGKPKGFAYVEFNEVTAAKKAHAALQGFEFDGRSIRLDFSQPRDNAGGRGGGQGGRGRGFGGDRGRGGFGDRGRGGFGGDRGRGGFGGGRGRGGFGGDRGRGGGRGGWGGDRGGRGRGRGRGGITQFEGQKITFD